MAEAKDKDSLQGLPMIKPEHGPLQVSKMQPPSTMCQGRGQTREVHLWCPKAKVLDGNLPREAFHKNNDLCLALVEPPHPVSLFNNATRQGTGMGLMRKGS